MRDSTTLRGSRVLVTGGAGFIGANLVQRLVRVGAHIRATLHQEPAVVSDQRIEYVKCDLTRMRDCIRVAKGVDYVFMCAASTSGAAVIASTPLAHVTPNLVMNAQMLEASYSAGVKKFVWLSSTAAYPPSGASPVREDEIFNGDPYETYFPGGWMKRYTEILCRMYSEKLKKTMPCIVLRPSNVYGPHDDYDFATSHVTAALIRRVVERQDPITVWGTGNDVRDLIYVDDMVDAIVLAAEKLDGYDPVNIGLGKGYTVREVLDTLLEIENYRAATVTFDRTKPSMIPIRLVDIRKAERLLGFKAKVGLKDGLARTVEWYRNAYLSGHRKEKRRSRSSAS